MASLDAGKGKVQGKGRDFELAFTSSMPGTTPSGETALLPIGNLHVRLRLSLSLELLPDEAATAWSANSWPIDERMRLYQRGRTSIAGFRLELGKIIETRRLVEVA